MLIEYTKEQYDALPGAQQKLCTEKDGKYTFEFETVAEVAGLKKNKADVLKELAEAKKALDAYKGIDPAKHAELLKAHEDAERAALEGKGQWQVLEQQLKDQATQREKQLVDAHAAAVKKLEDRAGSLTSALEAKLVDAEAMLAITNQKGAPALLLPHVKAKVKVFEEDGVFVAKVVDEKGNPRIGDAQGTPMSIEQLVEEMKGSEVFGRAFDASGAGGSGASNGNGGAGNNGKKTITRTAFDQLSQPERDAKVKDGFVPVDG